ncbi:carbohydrate ABC transporter permease [Actinacidiphila sp. bgisy144]|uniref:carbohydrate ABC transporter permease n=1 Tax=Actinacidiphila sp. bgisy144 TaxID=3413791 RepID=UPI003EBD1448
MATTATLPRPARLARLSRKPGAQPPGRRRGENLQGWALAAPSAVIIGLFFVLPFGLMIWMSFFHWPAFGAHTPAGTSNYSQALSSGQFWHAVRFTAEYTAVTSVIGIAVSLALALLVRPRFPGRTAVRALLFAPVTIGFAPAGLLWLSMSNARTGVLPYLAQHLGLSAGGSDWYAHPSTTLAVVVVMTVWKTVGLAMLVLLMGMDSIPDEIYEAARLDGAGPVRVLKDITLPLIRKPLSLVVLLTVTTTFLGFDQFYTMTKGGPDGSTLTVVYYLYKSAFLSFQRGYAAAVAVVVVAVMAGISVLQVRLQRGKG